MAYDPLNYFDRLREVASADAAKIDAGIRQDESIEEYEEEVEREMIKRQQMAHPGDAIAASIDRLWEEGPEVNPARAVQREFATQMLTPSDLPTPLGNIPYGDAMKWIGEASGIDPKQLYLEASGKKYLEPREIETMFNRGEITSAQKRHILKEQMTFQDNLGRQFKELHQVFGEILPGAASYAASVGTHLVEGDTEKLSEDAKKAFDVAGIAGDHIVASLIDLTTRPFEYAREDFIDAATWVPIGWYAKGIRAAGAGAKATKAAPKGAKAAKEAYKTYYHANNATDVIRGAASAALSKVPVPNIVKQTFFDMYAGVDNALEVLRTKMRLSNQKYNIIFEERVLRPLEDAATAIKKEHGENAGAEIAKLFNALVEGVEDIGFRKEALGWLRKEEARVMKSMGINRAQFQAMEDVARGATPRPASKSELLDGVEIPMGSAEPYLFEKSVLRSEEAAGYMDSRFIGEEMFQNTSPGFINPNRKALRGDDFEPFFFGRQKNGAPMLFFDWKQIKELFDGSDYKNIYEFIHDQLHTDLAKQSRKWKEGNEYVRRYSDPDHLKGFADRLAEFEAKGFDEAYKSHMARLLREEMPVRGPAPTAAAPETVRDVVTEGAGGERLVTPEATVLSESIIEQSPGVYVDKSKPSTFHGITQYARVPMPAFDKIKQWPKRKLQDKIREINKTLPKGKRLKISGNKAALRSRLVEAMNKEVPRPHTVKTGDSPSQSAQLIEEWRGQARPQPKPKNVEDAKRMAHEELMKDGDVLQRMWDTSNKLDAYQPKEIVWTYDGVPMTSSEFMFDLSFGNGGFKPELISYALMKESSPVVKQYAETLLQTKKLLSDLLARQIGVRGNKLDNGVFLTEDLFKSIVGSYLPMVKLPREGGKVMNLNDWMKFADETRRGARMTIPGSEKVGMTYYQPGTPGTFDIPFHFNKAGKSGEQLLNEGYSIGERFIEGLQLSVPKLIDDVERYALYQGIEPNPKLYSPKKVEGWERVSGKPSLYRSKDAGGNVERFGVLEGGYVPPEVARILKMTEQHVADWDHWWPKFTKQYSRVLNMVKHNKLIANYASHAHNQYGMWIVLAAEGINPLKYFSNLPEFRKGFDNFLYEAQALTGTLPKSAPGFGSLDDVFKSISEARSPVEFMKIMARETERLAAKEGWTKAAISTAMRGSPELAMKMAEFLSYKVFGAGGNMAKFFTASDRLARYTLFKSRMEKLAKMNGVSLREAAKIPDLVNDAARFAEEVMLQYADLPFLIQGLRQVGTHPFIAYPWRAAKYALEYPFRNPGYYKGLIGAKAAMAGVETPEQAKRREGAYPGDFLFPMSDEFRDVANVGMKAIGADPYRDVTVSPRYVTPVPVMPEEAYGYGVDRYTGADLLGDTRPTYEDKRNVFAKETGINMPLPIHVEPAMEMAFGDPIKAAFGVMPSYVEKSLPKELGGKDTLWGEPYKKRDFIMQAFTGLRHMPQVNRSHALDIGRQKVRKLKKTSKWKDASYNDKMKMEQEGLRRGWRDRKF